MTTSSQHPARQQISTTSADSTVLKAVFLLISQGQNRACLMVAVIPQAYWKAIPPQEDRDEKDVLFMEDRKPHPESHTQSSDCL
jgi:hypothetical protein